MKETHSPNFLIIGAAKAATTSLSSLLESHPEAAIARSKEPHFFSYDHHYQFGWAKYLELFSHCKTEKAIGDASTSYSRIRYHPQTIPRIQAHLPETKIIYMVRHPLERMESAYVEHLATPGGAVFSSINDAVRRMPMIIDSSRYWEVFDAYRKAFQESQIMIVWFEEYVANQVAVFQEVCRFLKIDDTILPDLTGEQANSRERAKSKMKALGRGHIEINTVWDDELRNGIIDQLREDNCRILEHFGKPRDYWGVLYA
jgi:hypothetical protein